VIFLENSVLKMISDASVSADLFQTIDAVPPTDGNIEAPAD
jgi:hypothetical protein